MKTLVFIITFFYFLTGCSEHGFKKAVYESAASHQCTENFKNDPNAHQTNGARCPNEKELDGKSYEDYERERRSPE